MSGSDLASSFLEQGLLDEVRITLTSVLLAAGKTVFGDSKKHHPLKLLSTKTFKSGNVLVTYQPMSCWRRGIGMPPRPVRSSIDWC